VKPCCCRQARNALRLAEPVVPVVPVVDPAEVVVPVEAELDPHAETTAARTSPRTRRPSAFAAVPRVRCRRCVMESASLARMIGT